MATLTFSPVPQKRLGVDRGHLATRMRYSDSSSSLAVSCASACSSILSARPLASRCLLAVWWRGRRLRTK